MGVVLKPHQMKAVSEMKNGCVLLGGVGSGKTYTALAYYVSRVCGSSLPQAGIPFKPGKMKSPTDILVVTTARKRDHLDWEKEASNFAVSTVSSASYGGVTLKVISWNEIVDFKAVTGQFVVFDEQRLVGNGAWVKAFYELAKHNQWVMLSATPGDTWMEYVPLFVANGFYKNRTEFIKRHVVYSRFSKFPKVDHYVEEWHLEGLKRSILVDMPLDRHTSRHIQYTVVDYQKDVFNRAFKDRWHIYEDRPIRDVGELFIVLRKIVNTDPSRIDAVIETWKKHRKLIIFYNFDYELEALRTIGPRLGVVSKEWNGRKHEPVPDDHHEWLYLVQYTAGAEAWNCITTNATLFYSLNYSWKINEQAKGRIDRMNTEYTDLYYYILRSNSMIDRAIDRSLKSKRSFNEKSFLKGHYGPAISFPKTDAEPEEDPFAEKYGHLKEAA